MFGKWKALPGRNRPSGRPDYGNDHYDSGQNGLLRISKYRQKDHHAGSHAESDQGAGVHLEALRSVVGMLPFSCHDVHLRPLSSAFRLIR